MKMDFHKSVSGSKFVIVNTPCECGCDFRITDGHIGYITFSDKVNWAGLFFENKREVKDMIKKLRGLVK